MRGRARSEGVSGWPYVCSGEGWAGAAGECLEGQRGKGRRERGEDTSSASLSRTTREEGFGSFFPPFLRINLRENLYSSMLPKIGGERTWAGGEPPDLAPSHSLLVQAVLSISSHALRMHSDSH